MIIRDAILETVCGITSELPHNQYPEFAFSGKSNVGKSSLINALMNRKSLARTSAQPGKTQTVNYYQVDAKDMGIFYLVDLPGYGYANIAKSEKEKWGKMIENYLHTSEMLKEVFVLVDIRHEPSANDKMMYDWIVYQGLKPIVIATKADKIKRSQLSKQTKIIREGLNAEKDISIIAFSSQTKQGLEDIYDVISRSI